MNVVSIKRNMMTLELNSLEREILIMQGLQLELKELGCKAVLVPIAECKRLGLKIKKGAKTIELMEEDSRLLIEKAVNDCLREKIAEEEAKRKAKK